MGRHHGLHALHDGFETEDRGGVAQAVLGAVLHLVRQLGALDQGLARHAAVVQAVAAHFVGLHQSHFGLDGGRNVARHQATGARANDDQVAIESFGFQVLPARVDLAALEPVCDFARQQRKQPQQHKRAQQTRAQNAL